jgi:fructose-bisphosphate aldolase class I
MAIVDLQKTAASLVADGKGILAADETPRTLTRRFDALHIPSTPDSRRSYREMLFTATRMERFISGVILENETIHQQSTAGAPFAEMLARQGIIVGIKVDAGAKRLAGTTNENITEGLDGLRERLKDYAQNGRSFCQMAGGDSYRRDAANRRLRVGECTCAGAVRGALSGAGPGANRRA